MEGEQKLFQRMSEGFLRAFKLVGNDFTIEEQDQLERLEGEIANLNQRLAGYHDKELAVKKALLERKGLAGTSLELLKTAKGSLFSARQIKHDPYPHVEKDGEIAYFCEPCQLWIKGKPQRQIFVSEGVAAYKCLLDDHPMGKGFFPFEG